MATSRRINLLNKTFGKLTVISYLGQNEKRQALWQCKCICGKMPQIATAYLRNGNSKSCGCSRETSFFLGKLKHGQAGTKVYGVWRSMHARCENSNDSSYEYYGARGIKVCDRWKNFEHFQSDMGPRPEGCTVERINNDGDYSPENCRWATQKEQANNRRPHGAATLTFATLAQED